MPEQSPGDQIELFYFDGCPNHESFLPHLRALLHEHGNDSPIRLVEITGDEDARRHRFLGSPTSRIHGADVDPGAAGRTDYGVQCRLYLTDSGTRGEPPDSWILDALDAEVPPRRSGDNP